MTKKLGCQKEVFSKDEAMKFFEESDFIDCRINAFPAFTEYHGFQMYPPDIIFIDIDRDNLKTETSLKLSLSKTLKNIKENLDGSPTVLWTGNGYHIYQPIDAFVLEEIDLFNEFINPSEKFLRFAKEILSNNKSDKSNYPSFKSCLLRIPFSKNSKCISRGESIDNSQIKIIKKWDGKKPSIKYLLRDFRRFLIDRKIKERLEQNKKQNRHNKFNKDKNEILWIEKLLQTPLNDGRKLITSLILAPYLVNVRKLSYDESYKIINDWLSKCNSVRRLDSDFKYILNYSVKNAEKKGIPNMGLEKLRQKNYEIYSLIINIEK